AAAAVALAVNAALSPKESLLWMSRIRRASGSRGSSVHGIHTSFTPRCSIVTEQIQKRDLFGDVSQRQCLSALCRPDRLRHVRSDRQRFSNFTPVAASIEPQSKRTRRCSLPSGIETRNASPNPTLYIRIVIFRSLDE